MNHFDQNFRFSYPVRPDDPQWAALPDRTARVSACEMMPEELRRISTGHLLDAVLEHPYLYDFCAFDNAKKGVACLRRDIAAVRELLGREDAKSVIRSRIEALERDGASAGLQGKILRAFLGEGQVRAEKAAIVYVRDPAGSQIRMLAGAEQLTEEDKAKMAETLREDYPNADILAPPTSRYNCHSYAWYHSSKKWNPFCLEEPDQYWQDKSYSRVTVPAKGDIVYYGTSGNEHSGVVAEIDNSRIRVVSKWGMDCLVSHDLDDCPYYRNNGKDISYYRCNYKKGHVNLRNDWNSNLSGLVIRHRRGNDAQLEDVRDAIEVVQSTTETDVLTFYYENGITAPFDYWWIAFEEPMGGRYTVKDNFYCNITSGDDGNATLTIDRSRMAMKVSFSKSSSDTTRIMSANVSLSEASEPPGVAAAPA